MAIAASTASSSPRMNIAMQCVDELAADDRLGLQLGQLELGVLEVGDRLAERLALEV